MEHRAYRTYLEAILNDPKLLEPRDGETARELAEEALKEFKKKANSVKIDIFWRNCPSFLETLNTAVNLNTNKMIGRVSELHEDVSNTIFSITQDKLHFERKRVRSHEEESVESQKKKASSRKRGNTLPDGTKIKKSAPLDLFPDEEDSSEEHDGEDNEQDDDEDVPAPEEILDSILGSQKKMDSALCIYRCKDRVDMLDYGHTEIDVILKTCSYIIEGLNKDLVIRQKWGESFCPLTKSIEYHKGRKCDVRFLSTSGVDIGEWEFASNLTAQKAIAKKINVPFLQVASTSGQMLVEDLVEGFYVVFPGPTFEFPTKLRHIENLKSAVNIIKFVMDKYIQTNEIVESKQFVCKNKNILLTI
ncbi:11721_t:CDS:2, partial [Entrophospora sp. SA101]